MKKVQMLERVIQQIFCDSSVKYTPYTHRWETYIHKTTVTPTWHACNIFSLLYIRLQQALAKENPAAGDLKNLLAPLLFTNQ